VRIGGLGDDQVDRLGWVMGGSGYLQEKGLDDHLDQDDQLFYIVLMICFEGWVCWFRDAFVK
jgi:hypothetical protein